MSSKKFLDKTGVKILWKELSLQDYPKNETLMAVIEAIDETKADKSDIVQSNWNQNDAAAKDYIKNRPFYKADPVENVLIENKTINMPVPCANIGIGVVLPLEAGRVYKVTYNGVEYTCTAYTSSFGACIGNVKIRMYSESGGNGEPFFIYNESYATCLCGNNRGSITFSIVEFREDYVTLSEKFIPDTIARTQSVQALLDEKAGLKIAGKEGAEIFNDYENNIATGKYSHAEGSYTEATGENSHAEGSYTNATGAVSHAEGELTNATGAGSHAEGYNTTASGITSHTEGQQTIASANGAHAEGFESEASGKYSHAEGHSFASGDYAHAEGYDGSASGDYAHAEGKHTDAIGAGSHAEGYCTEASGNYSHAEGYNTTASSSYQHVQGKYNIEDAENQYAHIVGNGEDNDNVIYSNAHTLDWDGNAWFAGDVYVGGTSQDDAIKLVTETEVDALLTEKKDKDFVVTISGNTTDGFTADKTATEIYEAYNAGKYIYAVFGSYGSIMHVTQIGSSFANFESFSTSGNCSSIYTVTNQKTVHIANDYYTEAEIDTKLAAKADQTSFNEVSALVGDTAVSKQISEAVDGLVSYSTAQELTDEERAQARKNIDKYSINWVELSNPPIAIADYSAATGGASSFDMEAALNQASVVYSSWSSIGAIAFYGQTAINGGKEKNIIKMIKNVVLDYDSLLTQGIISGSILNVCIRDEESFPIDIGCCISIDESNGTVGGISYTHIVSYNFSERIGMVFYNINTEEYYIDLSVANRADRTLSKESWAADAKAVGDALALKADQTAIEGLVSYSVAQELTEEERAQARANIDKYKWHTFSDSWGSYTYAIDESFVKYDIAQTITNTSGNGTVSALEDIVSWDLTGFTYQEPPLNTVANIISNYEALLNGGALFGSTIKYYRAASGEEVANTIIYIGNSNFSGSTHAIQIEGQLYSGLIYYNKTTNSIIDWHYSYTGTTKKLIYPGMAADAKAVGDALALKADKTELALKADQTALDAVSTLVGDTSVATQISNATTNYYTKAQIDAFEFITVADIDEICGTIIENASDEGVVF